MMLPISGPLALTCLFVRVVSRRLVVHVMKANLLAFQISQFLKHKLCG